METKRGEEPGGNRSKTKGQKSEVRAAECGGVEEGEEKTEARMTSEKTGAGARGREEPGEEKPEVRGHEPEVRVAEGTGGTRSSQ
jgi:hypothetical protein